MSNAKRHQFPSLSSFVSLATSVFPLHCQKMMQTPASLPHFALGLAAAVVVAVAATLFVCRCLAVAVVVDQEAQ